MTMTRKDYRVVADALRRSRPDKDTEPGRYYQWQIDRQIVANELRGSYSNFLPGRFLEWTEK
jgi:hypothetical protein